MYMKIISELCSIFFRIFSSIAAKIVSSQGHDHVHTICWPKHAHPLEWTENMMTPVPTNYCRPFHCFLFMSPTWKPLHYHIILPRGEYLVHKTSLTPSFSIGVPVPSQECERSWIYMCVGDQLFIFLRFFYCILELYRQCGFVFCFFHFIIFVFTSLKFDKSACGLYDSCWLFCRPIIFNQIDLLLTSFHWISLVFKVSCF
jgi:hypothetical protein